MKPVSSLVNDWNALRSGFERTPSVQYIVSFDRVISCAAGETLLQGGGAEEKIGHQKIMPGAENLRNATQRDSTGSSQ